MRRIEISRNCEKFLRKLPAKHQRQIGEKLSSLLASPQPPDAQLLIGHAPYLRVTCGEYRIIYYYDDLLLYIDTIGKRNDDAVYKQFKLRH